MRWQSGDFVTLKYRDESVSAIVLLASNNGRSLLLTFDGMLGKHAGAMPVLMGDDGAFRSVIDNQAVELAP